MYVMLLIVVIEAAFVAITIILVRSVWGFAYSNDKEVVKYISYMTPLLATSTFMDAIQSVLSSKRTEYQLVVIIVALILFRLGDMRLYEYCYEYCLSTIMEDEKDVGLEESLLSPAFDGEKIFFRVTSADMIKEAKLQLQLAGPLAAANLLQKCIQLTSIMFVGHLGALPLSGVSIATSVVNFTGFSLLKGMGSAMDTLCGQSHGAKQYHMLGAHLQTAIIVLSIVCIPFSILLAFTQQILMAAGQDAEISREAGIYCKWLIPSFFSYALLQCETRFLQAQNIVLPTMVSTGFSTLLHLFTCWNLVFRSELGFRVIAFNCKVQSFRSSVFTNKNVIRHILFGSATLYEKNLPPLDVTVYEIDLELRRFLAGAALAISISYGLNALLLAAYIKVSPACKKTLTGFSKPALRSILNFLRLATPSAAMLCFEWWAFEIMFLMSGLLPNAELEISVLSIITRVSNELGAGKQQAARLAVYVMLLIVVIEAAFVAITIILVRSVWGYTYSDDKEVVKYISYMTPLLATSTFMDAIQSVLSGKRTEYQSVVIIS
ncbi:hypothetical protein EJ110_NYTH06219 [Nymphaea thermarum]|nr:hypothetical protein EJ110_NYTH06219 [Nymphaea thermarum]